LQIDIIMESRIGIKLEIGMP